MFQETFPRFSLSAARRSSRVQQVCPSVAAHSPLHRFMRADRASMGPVRLGNVVLAITVVGGLVLQVRVVRSLISQELEKFNKSEEEAKRRWQLRRQAEERRWQLRQQELERRWQLWQQAEERRWNSALAALYGPATASKIMPVRGRWCAMSGCRAPAGISVAFLICSAFAFKVWHPCATSCQHDRALPCLFACSPAASPAATTSEVAGLSRLGPLRSWRPPQAPG